MTTPRPSDPYATEAPVDIDRPGMRLLAHTPHVAPAAPSPTRPAMDVDALGKTPHTDQSAPAAWGWKGAVNRASGHLLKLGPGLDEALVRQAEIAARATFPGLRMITCASPKGASGKTPTALILAAILADLRRDSVATWDANEFRGTLGYRAEVREPATTVAHVLRNLDTLARPDVSPGELVAYMRRQPEGHLVLASAQAADEIQQLGRAETRSVHELLSRRFSTIIADTGSNEGAEAFGYVMENTDVLVVPVAPKEDHLSLAVRMLNRLDQDEATKHLVNTAILVVTSASGGRLTPTWEQFWDDRGIKVLYCPADPEIDRSEAALRVSHLSVQSRRAWTVVAAAVAEAASAASTRSSAGLVALT